MPRVIKLKYPIPAHGQMVDELTVPDRLKLKHLLLAGDETNGVNKTAALIAGVSGIPLVSALEIDAEDVEGVLEKLGPLSLSGGLGGSKGQVTSPTSSIGRQRKRKT